MASVSLSGNPAASSCRPVSGNSGKPWKNPRKAARNAWHGFCNRTQWV